MSAVLEVREPGARYLEALRPPLLDQFNVLATASAGVDRLRELILTLGVRGKLVTQNRGDEPAGVLIQRIRSRQCGRLRRGEPAEVDDVRTTRDESPFELPIGWQWARLGSIFTLEYGAALPEKDRLSGPIPVYGSNGQVGTHCEALVSAPSLVIGRKGSVGAVNVTDGPFWPIDTSYFVTPPDGVHLRFAYWLFRSLRLGKHDKATAIPGISRKDVYAEWIPLPPTAEQARIVARVDELMRLCDALEEKGRLEAAQHARLLSTLLGTLTDSTTPEELAASWQRVAEHFDLLLDRPEAVDTLEQTIFALAVRGLLLPQCSDDEPAAALVQRFKAQRQNVSVSRSREPVAADIEELPFDAPPGWEWVRFGDVASVSGGITLGRKGAIADPINLPYLRVANVQRWRLELQSLKSIVVDRSELERFQLRSGDLLITEGGDWDKVGRTAIWREELPKCVHQNHVFKARGLNAEWNSEWAELYLNSDLARAYFAASAKQTTNLASINMTELKSCVFPLPPLAEQRRIVARVAEVRRLCTTLRQRLQAQQATQSRLAEALVEQALAG